MTEQDQETSKLVRRILRDVGTLEAMEETFIERVNALIEDHLFSIACWWGREFPDRDFELRAYFHGLGYTATPQKLADSNLTPVKALRTLLEIRKLATSGASSLPGLSSSYCAETGIAKCGDREEQV